MVLIHEPFYYQGENHLQCANKRRKRQFDNLNVWTSPPWLIGHIKLVCAASLCILKAVQSVIQPTRGTEHVSMLTCCCLVSQSLPYKTYVFNL